MDIVLLIAVICIVFYIRHKIQILKKHGGELEHKGYTIRNVIDSKGKSSFRVYECKKILKVEEKISDTYLEFPTRELANDYVHWMKGEAYNVAKQVNEVI